jgi:hypothetical protein
MKSTAFIAGIKYILVVIFQGVAALLVLAALPVCLPATGKIPLLNLKKSLQVLDAGSFSLWG